MNEPIFNNDIMIVADEKEFITIKNLLRGFGFHGDYIFAARSQDDALYQISLIKDCNRDINAIIFDYRDPKTEMETLVNLKNLEISDITITIPKIVLLSSDNINFVRNSDQFKESKIIFIDFKELETTIKKVLELGEIMNYSTLKVLLVDDTRPNLSLQSKQLQKIGFSHENIRKADDSFEAMDILKKEPIDLVITDYEMPRINGLVLIENIKNDPALRDIPIILSSGSPTRELINKAKKLGTVGFLAKPFDIEKLAAQIKKAFPS